MAADLRATVSVDGTQAVSQAKAVGEALTQMGAAGDAAAKKVSESGQKMSSGMKEATAAAAAAKGMFGELQAAAARPVAGGGGAAGVTQLLQALEKARIYYQQLGKDAAEVATLAGKQAPAFNEVTAAAKGMTDALASTRQMASEMVAEGSSMAEIYAAVKEQITLIESPMAGMGNEAKVAFQNITAGLETNIKLTKEMASATEGVEAGFKKEVDAKRKAVDAEIALEQKRAKAEEETRRKDTEKAEAERLKQVKITEDAAAKEAAAEERAAVKEEAARAKEAEAARAERSEQLAGLGEGAMGGLGFIAGMVGIQAATEAVEKPMQTLKEAMKEGADAEQFSIQLKDVIGSAKETKETLEKLEEFVTGPLGSAFKMSDVVEGTRQLMLLTNTTQISDEQLRTLGAAAEANRQSFSHVAEEYGNVVNKIQLGAPIRATMLIQLQREGLISEQTVAKVVSLNKAHADWRTQLQALDEGMNQNIATAENMGNSFDNLKDRMANVFDERILKPFGAAITEALKQPMKDLTALFTGHDEEIKKMADALEKNLLVVFYTIQDQGIVKGLETAFDMVSTYVKQTIMPALGQMFNDLWNQVWKEFGDDWNTFMDREKTRWNNFTQDIGTQMTLNQAQAREQIVKASGGTPEEVAQAEKDLKTALDESRTQAIRSAQTSLDLLRQFGGTELEIAQAEKDLKTAQDAQKAATTTQTDAEKGNTTATGTNTTATGTNTTATGQNTTSLNAVSAALNAVSGALGSLGGIGGAMQYTGPFGGPVQITHYGYPGDPNTDPGTRAGLGAFNNTLVALKSAGLSSDLRSTLVPLQQFWANMSDGTKMLLYYADKTRDDLRGRVDIFDPLNKLAKMSGATVTSITPLPGRGVPGGSGVISPDIFEARSAESQRAEARRGEELKAQATIDEQNAAAARDQAKKPGGALSQIEKPDKTANASKLAMQALDDIIKKVDTDYTIYGKNSSLIDKEQKAGIIDATAAQQKKYDLAKKMDTELTTNIALLQAKIEAESKAYPTKDMTAANDKLKEMQQKLDQIRETEQQLQPLNPFQAFMVGVRQAVDQAGTLQKQMTDIGKAATDQFASGLSSAFTAITDGSKDAKTAFIDFAKSFLDQIEQMTLKAVIFSLLSKTLGGTPIGSFLGLSSGGGAYPTGATGGQFQHGGLVYGPTGVDSVPVRLTAGEFVMQKSAVDRIGLDFMHSLNRSGHKGYAAGGLVSAGSGPQNIPPSQSMPGGMTGNVSVSTTVNVGGPSAAPGHQAAGGGMSKEQITQFQQAVNGAIQAEITKQKRPGGLLNRNSF
jgi:hypothetical protein